ncbi:Sister chromatid cohesion protein 2 [Exophiala xenobiotica]|nr:Sister chromatid cohesion protein 2 [Exophiala xenobiotica]KAK5315740.1 Sister chromatid cohesion protein 2 [Exophiala xenobiotica]KAK5447510.1 Sister chromatid cohesion protein 2 [Exophiala xenobiotica]
MAMNDTIEVSVPRRSQYGRNSRQFTVDEAIQYTPMTTSILPAHDRIPIPQLRRVQDARLTNSAERASAYRSDLYTARAKERLAVLLDPSRLSEIKFKRPPIQNDAPAEVGLNPVQKMVLGLTKIDYTYPSTKPLKSPVKRSTAKTSPSKPITPGLVVEVPQPPSSFRRQEYVAMPGSPKRRKLSDPQINGKVSLAAKSKKEKEDMLLNTLENFLSEIFEAQDRLTPDTSASTAARSSIFELPDDEDESEPRLSAQTQEKLQSILSQLVSVGRLMDAPLEYLQRLQRICDPAIEAAQTVNLRLPQDPSEDDITTWLTKLHKGEIGAVSACTLIYTVLGASQHQDLVNLEVLQWLPNVLVNLFENCLIPVVEARPEGQDSKPFSIATENSEILKRLLDVGRKLLDLVAKVCIQIKGAGSIVNSTEFLAAKLLFVQNAYNDKASAIGSQAYERLRKQAMAALAKLYAAFPAERGPILDEVLTSLDKLPSNSRSARQYKLGSGKNIQLVSALFMLLVQTPAMQSGKAATHIKHRARRNLSQDPESSGDEDEESDMEVDVSNHLEQDPVSRLSRTADNLFEDALKSAQHIVGWMVDKASKVTKTGDSPYRNILDLFVEDLTIVLPSTDWPASELLLTVLAMRMISLAKNDKAASIKNMALECLGVMGSAISVTRASARSLLSSIVRDGDSGSSIGQNLAEIVKDQAHFRIEPDELISPDGPFLIVHSYMSAQKGEGLRTKSAKAYFLVQYATFISRTLRGPQAAEYDNGLESRLAGVVSLITHQLSEPDEVHEAVNDHLNVTQQGAQLAYLLTILNMRFCRHFAGIAKTLASSLSSDQAQVRSRSLKSVVTILETDASLLDWDPTIADDVFKCASDDSSLVRDSALSLIAKFIMPRPALEEKAFKRLLKCVVDSNVGVQKRAMGHLKDVYLRESRQGMKVTIAIELLRRTADLEASVADLAKKTLSEIWFQPKLTLLANTNESAHVEVAIEDLKAHIVACISNDTEAMAALLKSFLVWRLKDSKNVDPVHDLYARIVKKLLDDANGSEAGPAELTTLVSFAEARPQTVVAADLTSLKSYLKDLSKSDNILKFKSVVAIFRSVLPNLSKTQEPFLLEVQLDLMKAAKSLARRQELEEVMSCLRSIDGVLHNTGKIIVFTKSVLQNVLSPSIAPALRERLMKENKMQELQIRENKVREQSLRLAGVVAKHIDLESYRGTFQRDFPTFTAGSSVAGFIADSIVPFTLQRAPIEIRLKALESLGLICQAWPGQFNKKHVRETFFQVLEGTSFASLSENDVLKMQVMVLGVFDELYAKRANEKENTTKGEANGDVQALKNIGGDSKTREDDSAISIITNPLVDHLLRIVMSESGEKALLAAQTLASIDHKGMTHPKQTTAAFVALESSTDPRVSHVARIAHEHLHQQHESVCEREYINAVIEAFKYQSEVFKDPTGGTMPGYKAKLAPAFTIISTSGSKYVKKFLSNLISKLSTEHSKLSVGEGEIPEHVLFVLFVTQNLAFFEYKKMDELLHTVLQLELAFGKNGGELAQAIESNLQQVLVPHATDGVTDEGAPTCQPTVTPQVDLGVLKRLAAAACAITLISEARNYLKRQYGVSRDVKMAMLQNKQTKESTKEPVKVHGITGERYWTATKTVLESLSDKEGMIQRCQDFVTLVAVDDEVKIAEEEEELSMMAMPPEQPMSAPRGRKRKSINGSVGGTPKKPRGRPPKTPTARRSLSVSSMDDDPDGDFAG